MAWHLPARLLPCSDRFHDPMARLRMWSRRSGGIVLREEVANAVGFDQGWSVDYLSDRGVPHVTLDGRNRRRGHSMWSPPSKSSSTRSIPLGNSLECERSCVRVGCSSSPLGRRSVSQEVVILALVVPDVHVSFFEPTTLAVALEVAGFDHEFRGYGRGWDDIIRFKVLKTLGVRTDTRLSRAVPWRAVARLVDARLKPSAHPIGWARARST